MANFAKIDDNNVVLTVLHVDDKDCLDENGNESEDKLKLIQQTVFVRGVPELHNSDQGGVPCGLLKRNANAK